MKIMNGLNYYHNVNSCSHHQLDWSIAHETGMAGSLQLVLVPGFECICGNWTENCDFVIALMLLTCLLFDWHQMAVEATPRVNGKLQHLLRSAAAWTVVSLGRCRPFGTVPIRKTNHPGALDPVDSKGLAPEGAATSGANKRIDNCNRFKFWFDFRHKNVFVLQVRFDSLKFCSIDDSVRRSFRCERCGL